MTRCVSARMRDELSREQGTVQGAVAQVGFDRGASQQSGLCTCLGDAARSRLAAQAAGQHQPEDAIGTAVTAR